MDIESYGDHYTQSRKKSIHTFRTTIVEQSSFFLATLDEWLQLNERIRISESIAAFKQKLLLLILPLENSIFNILDTEGLKLLTRLLLGFSHLNKRRFRQNF